MVGKMTRGIEVETLAIFRVVKENVYNQESVQHSFLSFKLPENSRLSHNSVNDIQLISLDLERLTPPGGYLKHPKV